jgi:hypothetical protein
MIAIGEAVVDARKEALEKANDALKVKLDWLANWQRTEASRGIMGRWDLGEEIDEIWADLRQNAGRTFGKAAKKTVALFMKEDPSIVNMAHKLYLLYPDRKRLVEMTEMVMQDGVTSLSYSHIRQLITIKDERIRMQLLNRCLEHCWTSAELGVEVQKLNGGIQSRNPNGRAATPKDAETVIGQMMSFADDFDSRNIKVWRDQRTSLSSQVDRLEPIQYTEDLANKLGELAHRMRQLATEANTRAEEAERKHEQVMQVLKTGPAAVNTVAEMVKDKPNTNERHMKRIVGRRVKVSA